MKNELEFEEKFIVINKKRLVELLEHAELSGLDGRKPYPVKYARTAITQLENGIKTFVEEYKNQLCEFPENKYLVCNQDEPYAEDILDIILNPSTYKEKLTLKWEIK